MRGLKLKTMNREETIAWINEPGITPEERARRKTISFGVIYGMEGPKIGFKMSEAMKDAVKGAADAMNNMAEKIREAAKKRQQQPPTDWVDTFLRGRANNDSDRLKGLCEDEAGNYFKSFTALWDDIKNDPFTAGAHYGFNTGPKTNWGDPQRDTQSNYQESIRPEFNDFPNDYTHMSDAWEGLRDYFNPKKPKLIILSYPPEHHLKKAKDFIILRRINSAIKLMKTHNV